MIQSKAIEIIKALSRKEFLQFGIYIESSAFTSNRKLTKLFSFLKKYYPDFSSPKFTKENMFRSVYGSIEYNDVKARKVLSDLYKEVEKFIVIKGALSERDVYTKVLLKEFDRRKLDNLFISSYDEYSMFLDKNKKNSDYFLEKFVTEWRNILFYMERGMQHKITKNIYKRIEYLIFFFICDLSLSLNDIDAHKISFNTELDINLANEFMSDLNHKKLFKYIEKNDFENKDIVYIYYLGYLATTNFGDERHYYSLKDFVLTNFNKFNEYSQRASLLPLINYCVRKVSIKDDLRFNQELYFYYNMYIKYRLYNISGKNYIRNDVLLNIFTNFFSISRTSEIKKFVEDNIVSIQPSHRKNMLAYANALMCFENKDFAHSLKNATLIKSNTQLYKDAIKILTLKNHFELKNYEIARECVNSYHNYLNEKKNITEIRRQKRLKFLSYYNMLWKHFEGKKVQLSLKELEADISKDNTFTESKWILEKVKELSAVNAKKY